MQAPALAAAAPVDPGHSAGPSITVVPVERGTVFDPSFAGVAQNLGSCDRGTRSHAAWSIDPGVPVEGDDLGRVAYTPDGSRVVLTNMMTDNVTVFDASTKQVLANVAVGDLPYGVAATNDLAVVACPFSNAVYVIDLSDYTVAGIVPIAGSRPWIVRLSPDGRYAYTSTELGDTCEKIDLATMTRVLVIPNFPMELASYSYNSENGRFWATFLTFEVTPDGTHVFTGDWQNSIRFYDTTTGVNDHTISGVPNVCSVALSGDGARAIAMGIGTFQLHQIDLATFTKLTTVTPAGITWGPTIEMAVNQDGSKVFVSEGNNRSAIVRFPTHDYVLFNQTLSPFWIGVTGDHAYAVGGQNTLSIVSFATESVVGQWSGNPEQSGAVSPVARRAVAFDPHRSESLFFYDFTVPSAPAWLGSTESGEPPEGDAPRRVAITPDGSKAVVTNVLSGNLTILDLGSLSIEAIVPVGSHPQEVAITSDSRWALVTSVTPGKLSVLDLQTDQVVANVPCGNYPIDVVIAPGDETAYVADVAGNYVFAVALDGPASHVVAQTPVGEIGLLLIASMVGSGIAVSPDGNEVLVAVSFEDKVRVIDTATHAVVAEVWVGDFPIRLAFEATGDYATCTNYLGETVTTMRIDGANSTRIDTWGRGDGPLRLDYDAVHDEMAVGHFDGMTVVRVDPATGDLLGTENYAAYGKVVQVRADEAGESIVLAAPESGLGSLVRDGESVPLPAQGVFFDYCVATRTAVVVSPGPDYATVVRWMEPGHVETSTLPLDAAPRITGIAPVPSPGSGRLAFSLPIAAPDVAFDLIDPSGRVVGPLAGGSYGAGRQELSWSAPRDIPSGTYFVRLMVGGRQVDARKLTILGR
ncbi:MAG: cytochrome D1 domain-containing protein [Candidatus Eisenbacteria bacterium]